MLKVQSEQPTFYTDRGTIIETTVDRFGVATDRLVKAAPDGECELCGDVGTRKEWRDVALCNKCFLDVTSISPSSNRGD